MLRLNTIIFCLISVLGLAKAHSEEGTARGDLSIHSSNKSVWSELKPGFDYRIMEVRTDNSASPFFPGPRIYVVRVDLRKRTLHMKLRSEEEFEGSYLDVVKGEGWLFATNAGMYREDLKTAVSYMKHYNHINNSHHAPKYNGILAFHPRNAVVSHPVQIINRLQSGWEKKLEAYQSGFGNSRMISGGEAVGWNRVYANVATAAVDEQGRLLFFYAPFLVSMADFIEFVQNSDLAVRDMVYLEGGSKGAFYLNVQEEGRPGLDISIGYTGFLPNLIGIK